MTATPSTRDRILQAALACFLAEGYEGTTTAAIRAEAGVSNGALFHHFKTKEAIAAALFVAAIEDFQQGHWEILADPPATLREGVTLMVRHHLEWVQSRPDQARFLYKVGKIGDDDEAARQLHASNSRLVAAYSDWFRPFIASGEARPVRPGLVVAIVAGPAHAVARHWLSGSRERPLTRHADELAHAAWAGLAGPAALDEAAPVARPQPTRVRVTLLTDDGAEIAASESSLMPAVPTVQ